MFSLQQRFHLCENSQILAPRCIFSINGQDHLSGNYLDKHGTNGHCDDFSQAPRNDFCKFNREAEVYLKTETRLCYNFLRFSSFPVFQQRSQFSALSSSALASVCPWTPVIIIITMDQNHQKWRNSPVTITTRHLSVDQVDSARSTVRATLESTQTTAGLVIFS